MATNEEVKMGSFKTADNGEVRHIAVLFLMRGSYTTEKVRTKIYSDSSYASGSLLYTSSWVDIINAATSNYFFWLRTDFALQNISKQLTYYLSCEINNYTRNGYTKFVSLVYDCPVGIYGTDTSRFQNNPLAFKLIQDQVLEI
jgi:hypothetical protein